MLGRLAGAVADRYIGRVLAARRHHAAGLLLAGCRRNWWKYLTSRFPRLGRIAQLVEQLTLNQRVQGSSPCAPTSLRQ